MNEMENQRIIDELHKQRLSQHNHHHHPGQQHNFNRHSKDSGVVDIDMLRTNDPGINRLSAPECSGMKKNALSNSLIDLSEGRDILYHVTIYICSLHIVCRLLKGNSDIEKLF